MNYQDFHNFKFKCNKLTEELVELATAMMHQRNKPKSDFHREIEDELADVEAWLFSVKQYYDTDYIDNRVKAKRDIYSL
jgi:NTP pyrophosphatase (non-canonical NTP hydrolase)